MDGARTGERFRVFENRLLLTRSIQTDLQLAHIVPGYGIAVEESDLELGGRGGWVFEPRFDLDGVINSTSLDHCDNVLLAVSANKTNSW